MAEEVKPTRVLIVVDGGLVQSVVADGPVKVLVKDFDNIEEGDTFDPNGFQEPDIVCIDDAAFMQHVKADIK